MLLTFNVVNNGKKLERFVAATEEMASGDQVIVEVNRKEYFDSGIQRIEYDIYIENHSAMPPRKVLIECRDRPSVGAADGAWIEQIVGRKLINGFNVAVAVSTTGFSEAAIHNANVGKIELRNVDQLESPKNWLCSSFTIYEHTGTFYGFSHIQIPEQYRDNLSGFVDYMKHKKGNAIIKFDGLRDETTALDLFQKICLCNNYLTYDGLPSGVEKPVRVSYDETRSGLGRAFIKFNDTLIRVSRFLMEGSVVIRESINTFPSIKIMTKHGSDELISQKIELPDITWASKNMSFFEIYKPDGTRDLNLRLEPKSH